ncbi:MAG: D-glycero-beta-D-manno-heptose-7-phosphate kinase [Nitrospira sp.]|jgi:D-beta-D-heptose 7-phosphate kinase/D-beta-D-heptose 1-phosphate adenosyltransferase|nr:D-glycero-beta-D-manno-heptose-7-phosphate kinase [Nitrospira sp.]
MGYKKLLSDFRKKKILVIGDLILDRYIWGKVNRISPEAPVPIVEVTHENFLLGGASNVANNIVALGGHATIVGVIGNDRAGDVLLKILGERGIQCEGVFQSSRPTTVKTRVIAQNQQMVRFDREDKDKISGKVFDEILKFLRSAVPNQDAVIISDYKKGVTSSELVKAILKYSRPAHIFVSVDPKVRHFHCYKNVSLITPNVMEASIASGIEIKDENSLINAGRTLLKKVRCDAVLITRGEQGMSLFENEKIVHIPTVAKNVYDVTGAGDTVIAAFTLAYAAGASMVEAAVIANHAAGIVVGEVGTAVATPDQLRMSLGVNRALKIRESSYA